MPIDRRITNGLAWAGALIVVAIPAADVALRQLGQQSPAQVAIVDPQPEPDIAPDLPTPAAQRPQVVASPAPARAPIASDAAPAEPVEADPVVTANAGAAGGDVVRSYLQSGRPLPSYISDGAGGESVAEPQAARVEPVAPEPEPDVEPVTETVAALPQTRQVTFPTPVSERPASVPRPPVIVQPPLVVEAPGPVITALDLEDWESGPLSEFLARRGGGTPSNCLGDYDPDGFFLDEGPNARNRAQRFPQAYEYDYYPFE